MQQLAQISILVRAVPVYITHNKPMKNIDHPDRIIVLEGGGCHDTRNIREGKVMQMGLLKREAHRLSVVGPEPGVLET